MLKRNYRKCSLIKMIDHINFEEGCLKNFSSSTSGYDELRKNYIWKGDIINYCEWLMEYNSIKLIDFIEAIQYDHFHESSILLKKTFGYFNINHEMYQKSIDPDVFLNLLNFDNFKLEVDKTASCHIICQDQELKNKYKKELEFIKDMILIVYFTEIDDIITGALPLYIDNKLVYVCE